VVSKDEKSPSARDEKKTPSPGPSPNGQELEGDSFASLLGPSSLLLSESEGGLTVPLDEEAESSPALSPSAKPSQPAEGEDEGLAVVRLDEPLDLPPSEVGGRTPPLDEKTDLPPLVKQPPVPPSEKVPIATETEEDELRVIFLDEEVSDKSPSATQAEEKIEGPPPPKPPEPVPPPAVRQTPAEEEEMGMILLDDVIVPKDSVPAAKSSATPGPFPEKPAIPDFLDVSETSPLLIGSETVGPSGPEGMEEPLPLASEAEKTFDDSLIEGRSSLLLDAEAIVRPPVREELPVEGRRGRRRRRERVRIVPPEPSAQVKWFSNPNACALYCRKHHRPLLLYFTTGDTEQCRTYEETIRMGKMRPFLCSYVCCMVNMVEAEGRKVAMRLGVPTDSPAMVLLSPTGREYARVLKSEVDWRFLATMLFWALR